jgi:basic amino acid/polyamine antiporter, APA family
MGENNFWKWFSGNAPKKNKLLVQVQPPVPINSREATGNRKLGKIVILFILINSILGSSLFYLPGLGVKSSGAASIIAWAVLFVIAVFIMLYMGELVTLHPTSGGTYEFCKRAYGRFGSFLTGWLIWIAGNFGMALAVVAAAEYFIPETSAAAFVLRMMFVALWIIVLNFMAYRGIDAGSTMLLTFGIIAIAVVIAMILPSFVNLSSLFGGTFSSFDLALFKPFFRHENVNIFAYLGLSLFLISEAFLGFEVVSYMANEAKEPKKLHKVMILGMVICGLIMLVYILSSLGTVGYHDYVTNARPFAIQALNTLGVSGEQFVIFGMYLVIVGTAAAWPITGSRLLQAMASDKLFIKHVAVLHPKHKSPHRAVYFQTVMVFIFSWLIFRGYKVGWSDPYRVIYLIYVLLSLLVVSLVLLTVPILRRKEADLERPYKAPLGTIGPIFLVLLFMFLIGNWIRLEGNLAITILKLAGSFIFLGFPLYFMVEMFYNPKAITNMNERLAFFVVFGEKLFFPFSIRNKLLNDMGDVRGKIILEYGCSVGTLTKKLAARVGSNGKIFATDLSLKKVNVAAKRNTNNLHVSVHHHPHLDDFKLQLPTKVDGVLSVGQLSYMQNPAKILGNLSKHVKKGGEIVFLDFDKFFYFIPNVKWIENDEQLKGIFSQAGFSVEVERKRGLLWEYIIIYGVKV